MNKETMQRLAEVLGLEFMPTHKNDEAYILIESGGKVRKLKDYFTLERMIRLAIEYRIDIEWFSYSVILTHDYGTVREEFDKPEDAERALKEAIAKCVIAIKENE